MTHERPAPVWNFDDFAHLVPQQGYIRDYLYYACLCTDAPPLYHIISAIGIAAIAIAPQMDLVFQNVPRPLHMFLMLIGDSSASRKSSSIRRAVRVAEPVFDRVSNFGPRIWAPGASSPEGMLDELVKEPNRLLCYSEWTDLHNLQRAGYWKHQGELINTFYDASEMARVKTKTSTKINRPRISILGASTKDLINSAVTLTDWQAGKIARYLIGCATRPPEKEMEIEVDEPEMVKTIRGELNYLVGPLTLPPVADLSPAAWNMLRAWKQDSQWLDLQDRAVEHIRISFNRAQEHILRIATLYEATSRPSAAQVVVQPDNMYAAILLVEECMRGLMKTFSMATERNAPPIDKVHILLKTAGAQGLTRSQILRGSRIMAKQLDDLIFTFKLRGEIREEPLKTAGGFKYYYLKNED